MGSVAMDAAENNVLEKREVNMTARRGSLRKSSREKKACGPRFPENMPLLVKRKLTKRLEVMVRDIDELMKDAMRSSDGPVMDYAGDFELFVSPKWTHMLVDGPRMEA